MKKNWLFLFLYIDLRRKLPIIDFYYNAYLELVHSLTNFTKSLNLKYW